MATASRRARKISRHSHWPTATRPAVRGEGPPRPGHHHRGRPPVPGSLTNTARRPRRYGPPRRGPAPPGRPRRSRRRPDPHAQPGTARHAQRRQPAIGRTAVPAARGHAVPHPRRAVLTPGGRLRQRPLAARKRGNPRPHPETERFCPRPSRANDTGLQKPIRRRYPGQVGWLAGLVALRDRPSASRRALPPVRVSVACCWATRWHPRSWRSVACCGCPSSRGLPSGAAAGTGRVGDCWERAAAGVRWQVVRIRPCTKGWPVVAVKVYLGGVPAGAAR